MKERYIETGSEETSIEEHKWSVCLE
jgi:hypothetical protein